MTVEKRGFSVPEAAAYIGRSQSFIRQLKRDNKLAARRDGKALVFLIEDLDAYLDGLPDSEARVA